MTATLTTNTVTNAAGLQSWTVTAPMGSTGAIIGPIDAEWAHSLSLNVSGTWTGAIQIQASNDGQNWTVIPVAVPMGATQSTITANLNGAALGSLASFLQVQVVVTAAGTGSVVATLDMSPQNAMTEVTVASSIVPTANSGTSNVPISLAATDFLLMPANPSRQLFLIANNSSATLYITMHGGPAYANSAYTGIPVPANGGVFALDDKVPVSAVHIACSVANPSYYVLEG